MAVYTGEGGLGTTIGQDPASLLSAFMKGRDPGGGNGGLFNPFALNTPKVSPTMLGPGVQSGLPGAATTGAGIGSQIQRWLPLITTGTSLLGGALTRPDSNPMASQGARLQDLLPLIMQLIQQQQNSFGQRESLFNRQTLLTDPGAASLFHGASVPQGAVPLREAVANMAYRMLPNYVTQGLGR